MNKLSDNLRENLINQKRAKKVIKKYEKDKDGNIILKAGTYIISKLPTEEYNFTNGWIGRPQPDDLYRGDRPLKMFLIKSSIPDKYPNKYSKLDNEILRANNFIMTEIAKQFELNVAEYYNVVFEDSDELKCEENYRQKNGKIEQKIKPNTRYLATPSFREENEKLIHFEEILDSQYELNALTIFKKLNSYLEEENVVDSDIEKVLQDYIKQCIFNKFIEFSDEHNLNAAILITKDRKGKRARLAPCYDLDFSAGIFNTLNGGYVPKYFFRHSDNGSDTLKGILAQFYCRFERKYLKEIISKINYEEAISIGESNGNFKLSDLAKQHYTDFFKAQQKDLEEFYEKYCNPKIKKVEEKTCEQGEDR